MAKVTFPERNENIVELQLDGRTVKYQVPPLIGWPENILDALASDSRVRTPTGLETAAYSYGCQAYGRQDWAAKDKVWFPDKGHLVFPNWVTLIPNSDKFGELAGGILVHSYEKGQTKATMTEKLIPESLFGWRHLEGAVLINDAGTKFAYGHLWNTQTGRWDKKNAAIVALVGQEGAELLEKTSIDSNRPRGLHTLADESVTTPRTFIPFLLASNLYMSDSPTNAHCCVASVLK